MANMIVVTIVVRRSAGENSSAMLGRFSVPADDDQRDCGQHARHQRVAPRRMRILHRVEAEPGNRRQVHRMLHDEAVDGRDEQSSKRRERLCVAEDLLTPLRLGEQLGEPGHGGHELHAHPDEHETSQDEQHLD
jgi:hypothetical protein